MTVLKCVNLGWDIFNVEHRLSVMTGGLKVKAGNDANVAALGEMWQGGGKGYRNIVMVTLGTGVGGGVIIDGHILPGINGAAGEILLESIRKHFRVYAFHAERETEFRMAELGNSAGIYGGVRMLLE